MWWRRSADVRWHRERNQRYGDLHVFHYPAVSFSSTLCTLECVEESLPTLDEFSLAAADLRVAVREPRRRREAARDHQALTRDRRRQPRYVFWRVLLWQ